MAKAGFWLRGAKGKLAGASMQKGAKGQTIMREIVTPRNPKTNAQLYQRAIMATVMKLYSGMSELCDHSFQGVPVGGECQRRFVTLNSKLLRGKLATALATEGGSHVDAYVAPKTNGFVGFEAIISEGNYPLPSALNYQFYFTSGTSAADFYSKNGLVPGDIYTVVAIVKVGDTPQFVVRGTEDLDGDPGTMYQHAMCFARLQVKPIPEETPTKYGDIFAATDQKDMNVTSFLAGNLTDSYPTGSGFQGMVADAVNNGSLRYCGMIRSRLDEDLRSDSKLVYASDYYDSEGVYPNGILADYVLDAWKQGTEPVGDSDLILEGGNG